MFKLKIPLSFFVMTFIIFSCSREIVQKEDSIYYMKKKPYTGKQVIRYSLFKPEYENYYGAGRKIIETRYSESGDTLLSRLYHLDGSIKSERLFSDSGIIQKINYYNAAGYVREEIQYNVLGVKEFSYKYSYDSFGNIIETWGYDANDELIYHSRNDTSSGIIYITNYESGHKSKYLKFRGNSKLEEIFYYSDEIPEKILKYNDDGHLREEWIFDTFGNLIHKYIYLYTFDENMKILHFTKEDALDK